ncbi:m168 protein [Murid betaherpesvirus 1]|uniref:M168 protein n=1 Tax=Murid herpesvirus 1 TaxID=10366 RepID=H2A155_MUHV1|nr:m168 protein [Murid betaherpesvirus 1]
MRGRTHEGRMYVRERTRSRKKQKAYCIQVASPDEETVLRQTSEGTSFHSLLFRRSSSGGDITDGGRRRTRIAPRIAFLLRRRRAVGRFRTEGKKDSRRGPRASRRDCHLSDKNNSLIIIPARLSVGPPSSRGSPTSFGSPTLLRIQDLGERLITTSPTALGEQRTLADRTDVRVVHGDAT